jgi:hypothetical protein
MELRKRTSENWVNYKLQAGLFFYGRNEYIHDKYC